MAGGRDVRVRSNRLSTWWTVAVPVLLALTYYLVHLKYTSLPRPMLGADCIEHPEKFCAENSIRMTNNLADLGPRLAGSHAYDVTVEWIIEELELLVAASIPDHAIEYEVQKSSSSLHISEKTFVYQDVQSVVVRFTPSGGDANSTILVNSHFDTYPASPGAGSSAIMVSVMLEVLRVMSQTRPATQSVGHSVVFLLNGSRINGMHGSHAFMRMHRWAKTVRMFFNLNSMGGGGREMLFQLTPRSAWLMRWYTRNVVHPFASSTIQDLIGVKWFQRDTNTDFTIVGEYGNIPSLGFSLVSNGYVYQTDHDVASTIPNGTYQNIGDNLLSLCQDVRDFDDGISGLLFGVEQPDLIFFDYIGLFMVAYDADTAVLINVIISTVTLSLIIVSLVVFALQLDVSIFRVTVDFIQILLVQLFSIGLALSFVVALAAFVDAIGGSMRWFSNKWLIGMVYYCPVVITFSAVPLVFFWWKQRLTRSKAYALTVPVFVQMALHAHCVLLILLTLFLTGFGIRSAFVGAMLVTFYGLALLFNLLFKLLLCEHRWIFLHSIAHLPGFVYLTYCYIFLLDIFVPKTGRTGPRINVEIYMALFSGFICIGHWGLIAPLIAIFKRPWVALAVLAGLFVAGLICMSTPLGFPYRATESEQRFRIFHTKRTFHEIDSSAIRTDSGFFIYPMDRHESNFIQDFVSGFDEALDARKDCDSEIMCGLPIAANPIILPFCKWIPAMGPRLIEPPQLTLLNVFAMDDSIVRYHFRLKGTPGKNLFVSPVPGYRLNEWSLSELPWRSRYRWGVRDQYSVYFTDGANNDPFEFSIDFRSTKPGNSPYVLDIAIATRCINDETQRTAEYNEFLRGFPDWTFVMPCISSVESWKL